MVVGDDMHEHDSADDSTAQHADDEYRDTDGPLSRRGFLKASGSVGAGALALGAGASPAAALQEDCSSFGTLSVGGGDYQLVNNDWGSSDVDMCIWKESDGSYGYQWDTRTSGGEPNYPQALVGTKPWGSDTGVADFPIRRGDVDQLEMTVDVDQNISGGHSSSGWDLAEEWWLMEQPPSQATGTHVHECMMVLDWGGGHGHYMEERNVWTDKYGNTIDYWANYDGGGTNANFHIFRVRGGMTTGQVDLKPVIDYLSQRHGIGDDLWLSGIELGNEYWEGTQGDVTFNQFDVTINGTTYSSAGSSSTGGNSGGTSGGTDGGSGGTDGSDDSSGSNDGGSRSPYGGSPHALPGRIQAEDFDEGGEGTAYHDTTLGNEAGAYRSTDVDIESATEGGYDIGWIQSGEWWTYTVDVDSAGTYDLRARVASNAGGGSLRVEVDGSRAGSTSFTGTGGWQSWTTVSLGTANLSAGEHVVRVRSDAGGWNLNWIEFGSGGGSTDGGSSDGSNTDSGSTDDGTSDSGDSDGGNSGGSSPADLIAEMDPSTTSASAGQRLTFRVTDTSGSGRWIESLEWDFGDGTTTSGWWNAHSYDSAGSYVASLTATDNTGATTTHEVTITVS